MLPFGDSRLTKIAFIIFFILILAYAFYEARGIVFGPEITITSGVQEVREPYVRITGKAERIAKLSMNGKEIPVTEGGVFDQPYLLSPGLNRILLDATDKYGRTTQKLVGIIYTPDNSDKPTALPNQSSTSTSPAATDTVDTGTSATSTIQ